MSTIKKGIKYILFISVLCFLLIPFINNNKVNATEINNNEISVKNFQSVDSIGYLYNLDGSPNYIYVDFMGKNGYVIFSEETLEILEYTNNGFFPYESINEQKYYGEPYKYFVKNDENFKNILTNEEISFSSDYIKQISSFSRLKFNTKKKLI